MLIHYVFLLLWGLSPFQAGDRKPSISTLVLENERELEAIARQADLKGIIQAFGVRQKRVKETLLHDDISYLAKTGSKIIRTENGVKLTGEHAYLFFNLPNEMVIMSIEFAQYPESRSRILHDLRQRGLNPEDKTLLAELIPQGFDVNSKTNKKAQEYLKEETRFGRWLGKEPLDLESISDVDIADFVRENKRVLDKACFWWAAHLLEGLTTHGRKVMLAYIVEEYGSHAYHYTLSSTASKDEMNAIRQGLIMKNKGAATPGRPR